LFIARAGQEYENIQEDPGVSIAIAEDYPQSLQIKGLAGRVLVVEDRTESGRGSRRRWCRSSIIPRASATPTLYG
jgi:hypothetical protein